MEFLAFVVGWSLASAVWTIALGAVLVLIIAIGGAATKAIDCLRGKGGKQCGR